MNRRLSLAIAMVMTIAAMASVASSAWASPSLGKCSSCHSLSSAVAVHANLTSNNGTTASYSVSVTGPRASFGWAVYDGNTRLKYAAGASGTFSVATGKTYTVLGGNADGSAQLYNQVTVSPVASTPSPGTTGTPAPSTDPTPTPVAKIRYVAHFNLHGHTYRGLKAVLINTAGHKSYAPINRKGNAVFMALPGAYRLGTTGNKKFKFKTRRVLIGISEEIDD